MAGYADTSLVLLGSAPYGTGIDKARAVYLYPTADATATVLAAGYFNGGRARLNKGDAILAVTVQDGTPDITQLVVTAVPASPSNITVAGDNQAAIGAITPLTAATGVTGNVVSDVGGAFNQATLNNNFKVLADKINAIIGAA